MELSSMIAIYALIWVFSAFVVLPIGLRTPDEDQDYVVGQGHADSAPINFRPRLVFLRATIVATIAFALFYLNYVYGWISVSDLNFFGRPPGFVDKT
jgi:predicted secreted protein